MEHVHLLSARDLRSGEVRWDLELPGEVVHMEVRGGVVVTAALEELIAYG